MAFSPTKEQELAINANGNILVAAAAGSGKTAVLVERVIKKLTDENSGISADKLLIVTFTNAAAAEMRSRIEKRLDEEIINNPHNVSLRLQKYLLSSAKICTIDSFCIDLVRENFEKLGISPDFKISDAASLKAIDNAVLSEIFNDYLCENNPHFLKLLDYLSCEYGEENFYKFIFDIYNYSRQLPFPKKWFMFIKEQYKSFDKDNIYYNYAFDIAKIKLEQHLSALNKAIELLNVNQTICDKFLPCYNTTYSLIKDLYNLSILKNWDEFYNLLCVASTTKLPKVNGSNAIPEIFASKQIAVNDTEQLLLELNKFFYANSNCISEQFKEIYPSLEILTEILCQFDDKLFEEYSKNNTFTFHNTEHLALKLLCTEQDGEIVIGEFGNEFLSNFQEVLVDEYQDTNDLQDKLFYVLSNFEKKLFVVGDIKQSIYAFRGANPKNFSDKKKRYIPILETDENSPQKIILGNNFRCKPEVCEFINYFFRLFMNEKTGDIIYNSEEELVASASFPETTSPACEVHILSESDSELKDTELEAVYIADYISETIKKTNIIKESETTLRSPKYSDFAILLRSPKNTAPIYANELKRRGIPVSYNSEEFAETIEISTFLALLKVIDNPKNDVELLSVLMSPIFAFSPEEIAQIRLYDRKDSLYTAVIISAENGNDKAKSFLKQLEIYRLKAITNSIPSLITFLLNETAYLDIVLAMSDGEKRKNNLLLLIHYAETFSNNTVKTLSEFVRFVLKNSDSIKGATASAGTNAVKIMSIHASKGLQFPICILASANKRFPDKEATEKTLFSNKFGIGFKYFDEKTKKPAETIARQVILNNLREEKYSEELRLLYVAMTRTQDKLLILGSVSNLEKKLSNLETLLIATDSKIEQYTLTSCSSYLDWIIISLMLNKNCKSLRKEGHSLILNDNQISVDLKVICSDDVLLSITAPIENPTNSGVVDREKISQNIKFVYPYNDILSVESKISVSKLANSAESQKYAFSAKPAFLSADKITSSGKGTAMHKVMEFFDFSKSDRIDSELERLYEWQYISETEYNSIDKEQLKKFFRSNIFQRIKNANLVKREMRFITETSAEKVAPDISSDLKSEKIIVQGAVDVCIVEDDGIVILDFKTDRVDDINALKETYGEQLNIYGYACEKIFGKKVKEKIIYSFYRNSEVVL